MTQSPTKTTFVVTKARAIAGQWREEGATVLLPERAAKYYLPPLGSGLARPKAKRAKSAPQSQEAGG